MSLGGPRQVRRMKQWAVLAPHGLGPATNDMDRQASLQKH